LFGFISDQGAARF